MDTLLFMTSMVIILIICVVPVIILGEYLMNREVNTQNFENLGETSVNNGHKYQETDRNYEKPGHNDNKYSNINVINHFRLIQPQNVYLASVCRSRDTSTTVPSNKANRDGGIVCHTNATNTHERFYSNTLRNLLNCGSVAYTGTNWGYAGNPYHGHSAQGHMILHNVDIFCHPNSMEPHGYQLVFIHPTDFDQLSGFYYLKYGYGNIEIVTCPVPPVGALVVKQRIQLYLNIQQDRCKH